MPLSHHRHKSPSSSSKSQPRCHSGCPGRMIRRRNAALAAFNSEIVAFCCFAFSQRASAAARARRRRPSGPSISAALRLATPADTELNGWRVMPSFYHGSIREAACAGYLSPGRARQNQVEWTGPENGRITGGNRVSRLGAAPSHGRVATGILAFAGCLPGSLLGGPNRVGGNCLSTCLSGGCPWLGPAERRGLAMSSAWSAPARFVRRPRAVCAPWPPQLSQSISARGTS